MDHNYVMCFTIILLLTVIYEKLSHPVRSCQMVEVESYYTGVLLEAGTRVPAPVYSEHSTRLHRNGSQVDKYEIKSQTNRNFFSPLSCLARGV